MEIGRQVEIGVHSTVWKSHFFGYGEFVRMKLMARVRDTHDFFPPNASFSAFIKINNILAYVSGRLI